VEAGEPVQIAARGAPVESTLQNGEGFGDPAGGEEGVQESVLDDFALRGTATEPHERRSYRQEGVGCVIETLLGMSQESGHERRDQTPEVGSGVTERVRMRPGEAADVPSRRKGDRRVHGSERRTRSEEQLLARGVENRVDGQRPVPDVFEPAAPEQLRRVHQHTHPGYQPRCQLAGIAASYGCRVTDGELVQGRVPGEVRGRMAALPGQRDRAVNPLQAGRVVAGLAVDVGASVHSVAEVGSTASARSASLAASAQRSCSCRMKTSMPAYHQSSP